MKASIKFREDRPPLVRAKIPIGVLGLPFLSGFAASASDDARELRLDIATAFRAGPSLRLSYRPNDPRSPFSLVLKTGVGASGSPAGGSPLAISAEFGLLGGSRPTFSLLLKPRFGDFALKKSVGPVAASPAVENKVASVGNNHAVEELRPENGIHAGRKLNGFPIDVSTLATAAASPAVEVKVASVGNSHAVEQFLPENGIHAGRKLNGFPIDVSTLATGGKSGVEGLLSGFEVSARSVLKLPKRTAIQFKWGLRVPPELRTAFDDPTVQISLSKLPLLVMNKISIERSTAEQISEDKKPIAAEASTVSTLLRREVDALQAESGLLRRAVEELRAEVGGRKSNLAVSPVTVHRTDSKSIRNMGKSESLKEELMKASVMSSTATTI